MELLIPDTGTIIWMTIAFLIAFFILTKFAWKPITGFLKAREESIENAMLAAEQAKEEMSQLKADNEKVMEKARREYDQIIKEARDLKDEIVNEAKFKASSEANQLFDAAREAIKNERTAAITDIKKQIAGFSVLIAEKLLQEKLADTSEQKELIEKLLREAKLN